jgi:hypothetical protein
LNASPGKAKPYRTSGGIAVKRDGLRCLRPSNA